MWHSECIRDRGNRVSEVCGKTGCIDFLTDLFLEDAKAYIFRRSIRKLPRQVGNAELETSWHVSSTEGLGISAFRVDVEPGTPGSNQPVFFKEPLSDRIVCKVISV